MRSFTKLDTSDANLDWRLENILNQTTWENRSFIKPKSKNRRSSLEWEVVENGKENMAETFLNQWETLEEVIRNLMAEIDQEMPKDEHSSTK